MGLRTPYGNGPKNLGRAPAAPDLGDYGAPPVAIKGPQALPAPVQPTEDLGDYSSTPSATGNPLQPQYSAPAGPPEPAILGGKYRKGSDGVWQQRAMLHRKETWVPMTPKASKLFDETILPSIFGGTARATGAMVGDMVGSATEIPGAGIAGAGVGSAAGGYLGDLAEELTNISDKKTRDKVWTAVKDFVVGTVAGIVPRGTGKFLEGQAAQYAGDAAVQRLAQPGAEAMASQATQRVADSSELGVPLRRDQVNPENPELNRGIHNLSQTAQGGQALLQMEAAQRAAILNRYDQTVNGLKAPLEAEMQSGKHSSSWHQFFGDFLEAHESAISDKKALAFEHARQRSFDVPQLQEKLRGIINDMTHENMFTPSGTLDTNKLKQMKEQLGSIPANVTPFIREWFDIENRTMRKAGALGTKNQNMPNREAFEQLHGSSRGDAGANIGKDTGDYSTQLPLTSAGAPREFMPGGNIKDLAGPHGTMGDLNMVQTKGARAPGELASGSQENYAPVATQPGLPGAIDHGNTGPERLLPPNAAGPGRAGITLPLLDEKTQKYQKLANFQKMGDRTDVERAWGDLAHDTRMDRDTAMYTVLEPVDKNAADMVRFLRDNYSNNREKVVQFQKMIEHDPTNAAAALVDPKNPAQTQDLLKLVDGKQRSYLAGGFLDHLASPGIDRAGARMDPAVLEAKWKAVDPKVKGLLFTGQEKTVDKLINVAKAVEARTQDPHYRPQDDRMLVDAARMTSGNLRWVIAGGVRFVKALFRKNIAARDYLLSQGVETFMPNPAQAQGRADILSTWAKRIGGPEGKAATKLLTIPRSRPSSPDDEPTLQSLQGQ